MVECFACALAQQMKATGVLYKSVLDEVMAINWPSPTLRERALAFVQFLIRKRHLENTYPLEYTDLAYVYFLQKLGSKYRDIIKPLLQRGILQSTHYYRPGYTNDEGDYIKGQCLSYRINPELMDDDMVKVIYENDRRKQKCRDEVTMTSKRILRNLRIPDLNSRQLITFVKRALTDDRIRKMLKVGDEIKDDVVMLKSRKRMFNGELLMFNEGEEGGTAQSQILKRVQDDNQVVNEGEEGASAQSQILKRVQDDRQVVNEGEEGATAQSQILKRVQDDRQMVNEGSTAQSQILKEVQDDRQNKWVIKHFKRESIRPRKRVLIKDGKYCYVDYLDAYIKRKRRHLTQAYCDQLLRIKHRDIYADRNDTNRRLDSNITNLKSSFVGLLQLDGQHLSQIDLKNSQFRFFVMLLEQAERDIIFQKQAKEFPITKKSVLEAANRDLHLDLEEGKRFQGKPVTYLSILFDEFCTQKIDGRVSLSADYQTFRKLVKTGTLYEHLQKLYWRETGEEISRQEAKKMMFTLAFSSYQYWPLEKRIMKQYFPSIVGLIDAYKKAMIQEYGHRGHSASEARDKGNASFAVMLQQAESLVFIDRILAQCHKKRIKALSKHDSILCRLSDKRKATAIIVKVLNQLFGRFTYSLDVDGDVYAIQRRKRTRVGKVAKEFISTLFGIGYRANAPPMELGLSGEFSMLKGGHKTCQEVGDAKVKEDVYRTSTGGVLSPRIEALRRKVMGII